MPTHGNLPDARASWHKVVCSDSQHRLLMLGARSSSPSSSPSACSAGRLRRKCRPLSTISEAAADRARGEDDLATSKLETADGPFGPVLVAAHIRLPGRRALPLLARTMVRSAFVYRLISCEENSLDIGSSFATYLYSICPFFLAVLMYTLLVRAARSVVDADSPNYIWYFFADPILSSAAVAP